LSGFYGDETRKGFRTDSSEFGKVKTAGRISKSKENKENKEKALHGSAGENRSSDSSNSIQSRNGFTAVGERLINSGCCARHQPLLFYLSGRAQLPSWASAAAFLYSVGLMPIFWRNIFVKEL
jgi:hypothetical protein